MNVYNQENDKEAEHTIEEWIKYVKSEEYKRKIRKREKERIRQRKKKLKKQIKELNKLQGDKRKFKEIQYSLENTNMTVEKVEKDKYRIINKYSEQVLFSGNIEEVEKEALELAYIYFSQY